MKINNISKNYGNLAILRDINFELKKGEIVGLVGRNGVGKSTLMKILVQNNRPDLGEVTRTDNVGYLIEEPKLFLSKTGLENLKYLSTLYGIDFNQEKFGHFIQILDLTQSINKKVKTYSLGTKQKLALLLTLVTEPDFLILDEPTNGLDVETSQKVFELLQHLASCENVGILISSHQLEDIGEICNRVLFLENSLLTSQILGKNSHTSLIDIVFQSNIDLEIFTTMQALGEIVQQDGLKITLSGVIQSSELFQFFNEHSIKVVDFETKKETLKDIYLKRSK
ncbi:ABC transporter ATP-binding protein [Streptococcus henryi]|uniref:ABC transporter ATP-binding protein n=1 Tax=Streptococcus henryi TaxID=439219 RepID=UPI0003716484|nr:ABC transporter ATP-binding protein [Streptococcus henryi]